MSSIVATVMFGTPPSGPIGGACTGQGYCQMAAAPTQGVKTSSGSSAVVTDEVHITEQKGTPVLFELSPLDKSVLVMSFRMSDLAKSQPEQVAFFQSGEYNFEADYHFNEQNLFGSLAFHHNPRIEKGKKNSVHISGDLVTTFIHYTHD